MSPRYPSRRTHLSEAAQESLPHGARGDLELGRRGGDERHADLPRRARDRLGRAADPVPLQLWGNTRRRGLQLLFDFKKSRSDESIKSLSKHKIIRTRHLSELFLGAQLEIGNPNFLCAA